MISYIIPTRNREQTLRTTLDAIARLGSHEAEVIIIDNDSDTSPRVPDRLSNGVPVGVMARATNEAAAARNAGARVALGEWLVMLDDDSFPLDLGFLGALREAPPDAGVVSADIFLPSGARESGGLPEVFIGCGAAIRRDVFLRLGGYDPAFGYYAEEYDFAARVLLARLRVHFDPRFRVMHLKTAANRNMNLIMERLVRNNGWVAQRYAPDPRRQVELREVRRRYRAIACKESALAGFGRGLRELRLTVRAQRRTPMSIALFDRFTGMMQAREAIQAARSTRGFSSAAVLEPGKNEWVIRESLAACGIRIVGDPSRADALVIGTMSPGPMLDAAARYAADLRLVVPWSSWTRGALPAAA